MSSIIDGARLRSLAKERGLSVEDIAAKLDLTPFAVYKYFSGARNPSLPIFVALAELLEVEMEDLIKRDSPDQNDDPET